MMVKILIIDDDESILETLNLYFVEKGFKTYTATSGRKGLESFISHRPDIVILDIRLPDESGLDLLCKINKYNRSSKIIMITAYHDMESTVDSMKKGAFDYLTKPLDIEELDNIITKAMNLIKAEQENSSFSSTSKINGETLIGEHRKMREIYKLIGLVCNNKATVLIQGETGTGKELIAKMIHRYGPFSNDPFITIDCSSIVETLLESELFGFEKGAFTGAIQSKPGKIELAGNGILFLDEISELPINLQSKLLGFLQRKEFMRIGGKRTIKANCKIIAATNKDLAGLVKKNYFKEDLYYRLKVITINVPPLRERISDIPYLVEYFLNKINKELGTNVTKVQKGVISRLKQYNWPGNVRELENVLIEAIIRSKGETILLEDIEKIIDSKEDTSDLISGSLLNKEKQHIKEVLISVNWNKTLAAKLLGISLPTLRSKIKKYNLRP